MYNKFIFGLLCLFVCSIKINAQNILLNKEAPPIIFQHCLDKNLRPDFYKNKILVIDFWATWCAPCIAGFPHFNELSSKFGSKNVLFAALTNEPPATVNKFFNRTRKQLNALRLIDTTNKTETSLHIQTIPYTVIIDRNNIVRWVGNSNYLTADIIDKAIKNELPPIIDKQRAETNKPLNKPLSNRSIFSFAAAKSDTTKQPVENGGTSIEYYGNVIMLSRVNTPLADVLEKISGFGAASRIKTNDEHKLAQLIDIQYNLSADTSLFKNYKDAILKSAPIKNFIIARLGDAFNFTASVTAPGKKHYEIIVADTTKLHSFKSMQSKHGSFDADRFPAFEVVGNNLKNITELLESSTKTIITTKIQDPDSYDLSLNINNMETLNKSLLFHGLKLIEVTDEVNLLNINFIN